MAAVEKQCRFWSDTRGDAVVEATILFPIMIMIFAALMLLAMYLPTRAMLQRGTQFAATAISTERSDTWLHFDEGAMSYRWVGDKSELRNVYVAFLSALGSGDDTDRVQAIVSKLEGEGFTSVPGELTVELQVENYFVYKEIIVTATHTIPSPVDLSFVGFPKEIPITVTSTAVVENGDEFVRNMDIAVDFIKYVDQKYSISSSGIFTKVREICDKFNGFLGI